MYEARGESAALSAPPYGLRVGAVRGRTVELKLRSLCAKRYRTVKENRRREGAKEGADRVSVFATHSHSNAVR